MNLKRTTGVLAVGAATATAAVLVGVSPAHAEGAVLGADSDRAVSGQYIVVYEDDVKASAGTNLAADSGAEVRESFDSINAVSISATAGEARTLAGQPGVAYVQANLRHSVQGTQENPPSWGQDRVDQEAPEGDSKYNYPDSAGAGVTSYTIDTGVDYAHPDFEGRTAEGFDSIDGDNDPADEHGHGTHVTGTIAGTNYGLAKKATIVGVRVLDEQGYGTTEQIVAGIDWVTENHPDNSVANMSLGGEADQVMDDAVTASIASGVTYALAAGNDYGADACGVSPARTPEAITVGATDSTDTRADFSNVGECLDIFAPGVDIVSAFPGGGEAAMSGTSMASPHVAGAAALYLGENPGAAPADVAAALTGNSLDVVQDPGTGSPNVLLNTQFLGLS